MTDLEEQIRRQTGKVKVTVKFIVRETFMYLCIRFRKQRLAMKNVSYNHTDKQGKTEQLCKELETIV